MSIDFRSPSFRAASSDLTIAISPLGLVELADEEFEVHGPRLKACKACRLEKPEDEFHRASQRKDGSWTRQNICKPCAKEKARAYYLENQERMREQGKAKAKRLRQENPEYERWLKIRRKYGLSREEWETLLDRQLSRCAICRCSLVSIKICVDHDHSTGKVRGLLCTSCNFGVGYFRDNPEVMRSAAEYIEECQAEEAAGGVDGEEVSEECQ